MKVAIIYNHDVSGVINTFGMQNKEMYNPTTVQYVANALEQGGHNVKIIDGNMKVIDNLQEFMPRVIEGERMGIVFNMAYGIQGESRYTHLPSLLEMLGIPYVGSTPSGHALALDKVITKIIFLKHNIPTPNFWVFSNINEDMSQIVYPVIVKPKMDAVSFGLQVVKNKKELKEAVGFIISEFQQQALVEQFIQGREFCVGMLGNGDGLENFPVLEVDLGNDPNAIQSVEDKRKHPRAKICPAELPADKADEMIRLSKEAFMALELRDFARVDIRMDMSGNIYLLEINSMASLGRTGSYTYSAGIAGYDYNQLVNKILDVALIRYAYDSMANGTIEKTNGTPSKKPSLSVRIRSFLRSRQPKVEQMLREMVNINTYTRNIDGVNSLGTYIWKNLNILGFSHQVIPQVEIGNILLFSNTSTSTYDILFIANLDCNTSFKQQVNFKSTESRFWGTTIWGSKAGLAVMISALQASRFVRKLRKLKIGVLLTTDEMLQGRFSQVHIEQISTKTKYIIGLKGGGMGSSVVTSRSGAALYKCEMNLSGAEKTEDIAKSVAEYSRLVTKLAECTDETKGIVVVPSNVSFHSNVSDLYSFGDFSLSVRFNQMELSEHIDQMIKSIVKKKKKNKKLGIQIEGGVRRPPILKTPQIESFWQQLLNIAKKLDIRLLEEHRWSSTNLCFSNSSKPIIDGIGPIGGVSSEKGEYIIKHSLFERAVLLSMFLCELADKKKK